jgi:hypothetical protein
MPACLDSTYAGIASHPDSSTRDPEDAVSGGSEPKVSQTREKPYSYTCNFLTPWRPKVA